MGQFGEELRKERVSRGVALETISEKSKVVTRYLCALEDEHFDQLPGGILSRGIVRSYAKVVGLDESAWVERFLAASGQSGASDEGDWTEFVRNVGKSRLQKHARSEVRLRWIGVCLLLLILTGFGWLVWQYVSTRVLADSTPAHSVSSTMAASPDSTPR